MIKDDELVEMNEKQQVKELHFQKILEDYPDLLAGDQMDRESPRRWLLVNREMRLPFEEKEMKKLFIDHLFLDQDGIPTLVEVKRSSNPELRREVVAQMLDYASNAVLYLKVEEIMEKVDDDLSLTESFLDHDVTPEEFWLKVKTNLQAGKIRMLFVAHEIPRELISVIEFLNVQMNPAEVLAVEIKEYIDGEDKIKTLVPRVIGQTMEAQSKKGVRPSDPVLDEESFMENIDEDVQKYFRRIFTYSETNNLKISWGTKGFSLNVVVDNKNISLLKGYSKLSSNGQTIFSSVGSIKRKVENGDEIVDEYISETLKLEHFDRVSGGFKLNMNKNISSKEFEKFIAVLLKTIFKIRTS